jgi:hypothetical protein
LNTFILNGIFSLFLRINQDGATLYKKKKKKKKKTERRNKFRYYRGAPVNDGIDHGNVTDAELYRILTFIAADMFMRYL